MECVIELVFPNPHNEITSSHICSRAYGSNGGGGDDDGGDNDRIA